MSHSNFTLMLRRTSTVVMVVLASVCSSLAQRPLTTLHRFQGGNDGDYPTASLIQDTAGNFYGTTEYAGAGGYYGTVFELSPPAKAGGSWTETVLYSFRNNGDGARPTAGLILDSAGDLYGTASDSNAGGYGAVFEMTPPTTKGGPWTETVLYTFQGGSDGAYPYGGLVSDLQGNLYGTTETSVFELSPPASGGAWTFTLLHDFVCCTSDGWNSLAGLARDPQGNLYGTTEWGGTYSGEYCQYLGCGTVFEVSPPAVQGGPWSETVLYRFGGESDGLNPMSALTLDAHGNLYGTTYGGGALGGGTVFELTPPSVQNGAWTKSIIHNFTYTSKQDGAVPLGTLIFDSAGNLYGATEFGGNPCSYDDSPYGCGTVFELAPPATGSGAWTESILHRFGAQGPWPRWPGAGVILDNQGNLLGTTLYGGDLDCTGEKSDGCGTIFQIQ